MLIISGMSFFLMGQMNDMTDDIATSWLPSIDTARALSTAISNIRMNELEYLTAGSADKEETSFQELRNGIETMDALLAIYGDMIDEEERNFYNNANALWTQYQAADEEMMALAKQGRTESARAILDGECEALFKSLNSAFDDIITYNTKGSDDAAGCISVKMDVSKEKMQQMTRAMEDISSCSSEIGNLIPLFKP